MSQSKIKDGGQIKKGAGGIRQIPPADEVFPTGGRTESCGTGPRCRLRCCLRSVETLLLLNPPRMPGWESPPKAFWPTSAAASRCAYAP